MSQKEDAKMPEKLPHEWLFFYREGDDIVLVPDIVLPYQRLPSDILTIISDLKTAATNYLSEAMCCATGSKRPLGMRYAKLLPERNQVMVCPRIVNSSRPFEAEFDQPWKAVHFHTLDADYWRCLDRLNLSIRNALPTQYTLNIDHVQVNVWDPITFWVELLPAGDPNVKFFAHNRSKECIIKWVS